ncbi:putative transporter ESBP6 [Talaromyces islandicus]|uniref:Putative transporter ESBP6 n=1 Tax=Talaromyces islandicus TaxID=28573 RepID=A0A0U1LLB3_TALIS|nr:putative transporter ESBP6 [Talaromyces islandicus]
MTDAAPRQKDPIADVEKGTAASLNDAQNQPNPETQPPAVKPSDPPDGGLQAWMIVAGGWCANFVSVGWNNSVGIFQTIYENELLSSYSSSSIGWINSLQAFVMFALAPVFGKIFDSYGPRYSMMAGSLLLVLGIMMMSLSKEYYQFMLAQSICTGIGAAAVFFSSSNTIATWFKKRRALAIGIASSGSAIGGVTIPIMVNRLNSEVNFGWALRAVGFLFLGFVIAANFLTASRIKHVPKRFHIMDFIRPLKEPRFLLTSLACFAFAISVYLPATFIILDATKQGVDRGLASYLLAILNAVSAFGRIVAGRLADMIGRFNCMIIITLLSAIFSLALWIPAASTAPLVVFAALIGFSNGAFVALVSALVAQISDIKEIGTRNGTNWFLYAVGAFIGTPVAGALIERDDGGCQRCKKRKIKCDETIPSCNQCTRKGFECPGYNRPVKWSSKYQILDESSEPTKNAKDVPGFADGARRLQAALASMEEQSPTESSAAKQRSVFKADRRRPGSLITSDESLSTSNKTAVSPLSSSPRSSSSPFSAELPFRSPASYRSHSSSNQPEDNSAPRPWRPITKTSVPRFLEDRSTTLSRNYFTYFCLNSCCFYSPKNSFRAVVADLMLTSPLIYHSVMALSAAYMGHQRNGMMTASLEHKIEAIGYMKSELLMITEEKPSNQVGPVRVGPEVLISCILLGLTEAWHNPAAPPSNHLNGARILFKNWISDIKKSSNTSLAVACSSPARSFLVGIISYWESSAAVTITQPCDMADYLLPFCDQEDIKHVYVNAWTGISTPLFIYWSQTCNLGRHKSSLRRVFKQVTPTANRQRMESNLVERAWKVEQAVLRYQVPEGDKVEDTGDELTPVSHLQNLAHILRLTILLQLYLDFPQLLQERFSAADWSESTPSPPSFDVSDSPRSLLELTAKIIATAMQILSMASFIPPTSGAHSLLLVPLIVAGSILQPDKIFALLNSHDLSSSQASSFLSAETLALASQEGSYLHWREFVVTQFHHMGRRLGLNTIQGAVGILFEIWRRADVDKSAVNNTPDLSQPFFYWLDIMTEAEIGTVYA